MLWLLSLALAIPGLEYNPALVPGPPEIAIWAMEDAAASHAAGVDVRGFRYIWVHNQDEKDCIEDARVIDLCPVNMVFSKSANIIPSHRVNTRLMRIDLLELGVTPEKAALLLTTWEKLADLDRYITASENQLTVTTVTVVTESSIKVESTIIRQAKVGEVLTLGTPSSDPLWVSVIVDGKPAFIKASAVNLPPVGQVRTIGPQCGEAGRDLAELVGSVIPIVRHDFLLRSACTGDFVLRSVNRDGGLYYDFLQIPKGSGQQTDLQAWLGVAGADLQESQRLRTDSGTVIVRSNVTGRSRVAVAIRGRGGKPGVSDGIVYGTFDSQVGDEFDPDRDPWENLLAFKHQASEWIAPLPNGLHYYGLFTGDVGDQKFVRQDFAPDDVANDHTVPRPHSDRLVVGMCWRCHTTAQGDDGLKPIGNDLSRLFENGRDVLTSSREDADTLASRYTGDFTRVIEGSRDTFARAVFRATRDPSRRLEGLTPNEAFGRLSEIYNSYWYDLVDPKKALLDLGIVPGVGDDPVAMLRQQLQVRDIGEASAIVLLCSNIPVNRWQWEEIFAEAYLRSRSAPAKIGEDKLNQEAPPVAAVDAAAGQSN